MAERTKFDKSHLKPPQQPFRISVMRTQDKLKKKKYNKGGKNEKKATKIKGNGDGETR